HVGEAAGAARVAEVAAGRVGCHGGRGERPVIRNRAAAVVLGHRLDQLQLRCVVVVVDRAGDLVAEAERDRGLGGVEGAAVARPVAGGVAGGAAALGDCVAGAGVHVGEAAGAARVAEVAAGRVGCHGGRGERPVI